MPTDQICPECGAAIPGDARHGLCPSCVFGLLDSAPDLDDSTATTHTASTAQLPSESLAPAGTRFGDYELLEEIARGGMGVVYKARQRSLNRVVAVKMVLFGKFAGRGAFERFRGEAQAAASLRHPHIVAIHEIGQLDGQPFYAMDYVEGRSLAAEIEAGNWKMAALAADLTHHASRVTPSTPTIQQQAFSICRLLITLCQAVHHAHERGVLHRDLKPSNVLLDASGQPHLTDFGLARRLQEESDLTQTGQTLGSPNYMPPEQASGRHDQVSVRSDVYALGAILYHLLTGRPLFGGVDVNNLLRAVREDEPVRPRQLNPAIPADLETICLKCLEKEPGKRYATAQEFADDLSRFLRNEPIFARPVSHFERGWRWCQRKPALAGSLAAVAILLLAMLIGSPIAIYRITQARNAEATERQRAQTEATRAEAEALKARQARNAEAAERQRAQTQAARAEAGELAARQNLYLSDMNIAQQAVHDGDLSRALQRLEAHRPTTPQPSTLDHQPSTDLRGWEWRYLWKQSQDERLYILGHHSNGVSSVGILPDGKTAFSAGYDKAVRLWNLESRREIGLLPHDDDVTGAACSPDGRWLATGTYSKLNRCPLRLWDLATRQAITVLTTNFWLRSTIVFSPDSKLLAFVEMGAGVHLWNLAARQEVTNLLASYPYQGPLGVAFSPDGKTLAYGENEAGDIVLWDIARHSATSRLTGHRWQVYALAFSPDGQFLASGSEDKTVKLWDLAQGKEWTTFTNYTEDIDGVAFSPDGKVLATSSEQRVTLLDIATRTEILQLRGHQNGVIGPVFTQDGRTLITGGGQGMESGGDGSVRLWDVKIRPKETVSKPLTMGLAQLSGAGAALCPSPDGGHLLTVFTNHTFSTWEMLTLTESERRPLPLKEFACGALAAGGRLAAFVARDGNVTFWHTDTGTTNWLARPITNESTRAVFTADGKCLAIAGRSEVCVCDVVSRTRRYTYLIHDANLVEQFGPVMSLAFSGDGQKLMAGFFLGQIKVWDLSGRTSEVTLRGHDRLVLGLALLPDGRTLVSASSDIRFWDLSSQRELFPPLKPRPALFRGVSISPDGRRLAVGGGDGIITVLDLASRQEVAALKGHEHQARFVAFLPDRNTLVSAGLDQLRVWRAASFAETDSPNNSEKEKKR